MAGQFDTLPSIGHCGSVHLRHRHVPVDEIADIEVLPVGTKGWPFGQRADIDLARFGNLFDVDLECGDSTCRVIEGSSLLVRTARLDRNGEIALWADHETFG